MRGGISDRAEEIRRFQEDANCLYIYLIAKNTVDAKILRSLRVKDINTEIDKTEYALVQVMAETETQNLTRAGTKSRLQKIRILFPTG